jgi:hypothetical protein
MPVKVGRFELLATHVQGPMDDHKSNEKHSGGRFFSVFSNQLPRLLVMSTRGDGGLGFRKTTGGGMERRSPERASGSEQMSANERTQILLLSSSRAEEREWMF